MVRTLLASNTHNDARQIESGTSASRNLIVNVCEYVVMTLKFMLVSSPDLTSLLRTYGNRIATVSSVMGSPDPFDPLENLQWDTTRGSRVP
ncbi:hypothetical protein NPIL_365371 [Nephila pilipes]|uniref:Uncharacterized protein n=1 Tax=Nephila pilipes TaxID=299642 RepID=A0A8X6QK58_NEPPI|nr:hypothetical protein NPIL_365371 [Nephila pilipes]